MSINKKYEVIIIGGSYAGLSAAMSLARSLREILIIDDGNPCNKQTPYSHNFITHDGEKPSDVSAKAKEQVLKYPTVTCLSGKAVGAEKKEDLFEVHTDSEQKVYARKLLFATGLKDVIPAIDGFSECWGKSILHCPYCHGYEVKGRTTGILANGEEGFEYAKLIQHWSGELMLFTNGKARFTNEQLSGLREHGIQIIKQEIESIVHDNGVIQKLVCKDQSKYAIEALYTHPKSIQQCPLPEALGCELTEKGLLKIDEFQRTTMKGVYAAGDNSAMARAISAATASGTMAGAFLNKELIDEEF